MTRGNVSGLRRDTMARDHRSVDDTPPTMGVAVCRLAVSMAARPLLL